MKSHIEINSLGPCEENVRLGCALKNSFKSTKIFQVIMVSADFSKLTKFHTCKAVPPKLP